MGIELHLAALHISDVSQKCSRDSPSFNQMGCHAFLNCSMFYEIHTSYEAWLGKMTKEQTDSPFYLSLKSKNSNKNVLKNPGTFRSQRIA